MKKGLSLVLALSLGLSSFVSVKADSLSDAQNNLNNVNDSINDKKDKLNDINDQKSSTEKSLKEIDDKISASSTSLNQLNGKIDDLNGQIAEIGKKIDESNNNLEQQNELFKKRIRAMYINGNEGYLELLLSSDSFSDFIGRLDTIKKVMEYDIKLINSIQSQEKALEIEKSEVENKKKETTNLKKQADASLGQLQSSSEEKKNLMTSLEKDKSAYEKMIQEEENDSKNIANIIKTIQQQKEAEKKKAEEDKKNAEANNSNSGKTGGSQTGSSGGSQTVTTGNSSAIGKLYCVTGKKYTLTSGYGWRIHPVTGVKTFHAGIDIGVSTGTSVYALSDGVVIYSGWMSGYGNVVMIDHGSLTSLYGHNSSLVVKVGQTVKGGQLISYSGNTGVSTGPHLHFEMRNASGATIDPNPYYVK